MERISRLKYDFKYIALNYFIRHIPAWYIRRAFYILMGMKIGKNARIGINTVIINPENITIGKRTIINENCHLDGRGGLIIENDTSISFGTTIITATHNSKDEFEFIPEKVVIKDHVWIGANAIILNGSIIERLCIIGAGCVFKGDSKEKEIYIGNPAKKIRERDCLGKYEINYRPFFR